VLYVCVDCCCCEMRDCIKTAAEMLITSAHERFDEEWRNSNQDLAIAEGVGLPKVFLGNPFEIPPKSGMLLQLAGVGAMLPAAAAVSNIPGPLVVFRRDFPQKIASSVPHRKTENPSWDIC